MTKAAISIFVWGVYLMILGGVLLFFPNVLLSIFGLPLTQEIWIHSLGVVVLALGYYHIQLAKENNTNFFKWSTQGRIFTFLSFTSFVILNMVSPILILFGIVDLLGAFWTGATLYKDKNNV